jgi:hypothetical protein
VNGKPASCEAGFHDNEFMKTYLLEQNPKRWQWETVLKYPAISKVVKPFLIVGIREFPKNLKEAIDFS